MKSPVLLSRVAAAEVLVSQDIFQPNTTFVNPFTHTHTHFAPKSHIVARLNVRPWKGSTQSKISCSVSLSAFKSAGNQHFLSTVSLIWIVSVFSCTFVTFEIILEESSSVSLAYFGPVCLETWPWSPGSCRRASQGTAREGGLLQRSASSCRVWRCLWSWRWWSGRPASGRWPCNRTAPAGNRKRGHETPTQLSTFTGHFRWFLTSLRDIFAG